MLYGRMHCEHCELYCRFPFRNETSNRRGAPHKLISAPSSPACNSKLGEGIIALLASSWERPLLLEWQLQHAYAWVGTLLYVNVLLEIISSSKMKLNQGWTNGVEDLPKHDIQFIMCCSEYLNKLQSGGKTTEINKYNIFFFFHMQHNTPPTQRRKDPRLWSANRLDHYPAVADRWLGFANSFATCSLCFRDINEPILMVFQPFWLILVSAHIINRFETPYEQVSHDSSINRPFSPVLHSAICLRQRHKRVALQ